MRGAEDENSVLKKERSWQVGVKPGQILVFNSDSNCKISRGFKMISKTRREEILKHRWITYQGREYRAPSSGSGCSLSCECSSLPWTSSSLVSQTWPCPSD